MSGRRALVLAVAAAIFASAPARAQDTCASAYESAQELRRSRDFVRARADLRLCERSCPKKLAEDCSGWRLEVEAELSSVLLDVRDAGGAELARVRVSIDGAPAVDVLTADALDLDPVAHTLDFQDATGARARALVTLAAGEKGRSVSVRFPPPHAPLVPLAPSPLSRPPVPSAPTAHTAWSYVLGGVGLAGLVVGAGLGVAGQVERANLQTSCAPYCNKATQVNPIADEWLGAAVAAAAGAALLGGGVAVWFVERRPAEAPAKLSLLPGLGGRAWLSVTGRF